MEIRQDSDAARADSVYQSMDLGAAFTTPPFITTETTVQHGYHRA